MGATSDLPFTCTCGKFRAVLHDVGPREGDRLTCYCSDCRDFVRVIGRADLLDANGGNAVYQTRVAKLEIIEGAELLATLHMTDKPTMRWYSTCCNTPLFNTLPKAKPAFLSVNTSAFDTAKVDAALGPSKGDFLAHEAEPPLENARPVSQFKLALGFIPRLFKDTFFGGWKKSPLFDPETREPLAKPRRVSAEERAAAAGR